MDAPVGVISDAKDRLRTALANCTAFRTWDGADYTVQQAKDRIYLDATPPPRSGAAEYSPEELSAMRPFAVVGKQPFQGVRLHFAATGRHFTPSGVLWVFLQRNIPPAEKDDPGAADRSFDNMIGLLLKSNDFAAPGLAELSGQAGYLQITDMAEVDSYRGDPDDEVGRGDYQTCHLKIEWGSN